MNRKQQQTLTAIFTRPTLAGIVWRDVEALLVALGCEITEGAGSRVRFDKTIIETDTNGQIIRNERLAFLAHRPHPGKEAKRYQIEQVREYLKAIGQQP